MRKFSLLRRFLLASAICFSLFAITSAGVLEPEGTDRFAVDLDVSFMYHEENVARWEALFSEGSQMIWAASGNKVYLRKVTFYNDCPNIDANRASGGEASSTNSKGATADVAIFQSPAGLQVSGRTSTTIGRLFDRVSGPIMLYEEHSIDPLYRETLGHELAHYIFDIADEYKSSTSFKNLGRLSSDNLQRVQQSLTNNLDGRSVTYTAGELERQPLLNIGKLEALRKKVTFCSSPYFEGNVPPSSIMDADVSGNIDYFELFCNSDDHINSNLVTVNINEASVRRANAPDLVQFLIDSKAFTNDQLVRDETILVETAQQQTRRMSCAKWAEQVFIDKYRLPTEFGSRRGVTSAPDTEFDLEEDCDNIVVLLMDKSGSMDGLRLGNVKKAAVGLIDALDDDAKMGIVWFDSQPRVAVGIQELGTLRGAAKEAVNQVSAGGGTRIGFGLGVAYEQLRLLRENVDKPASREIIFLMTDGQSQDDTTTVANTITSDGVEIHIVALGDAVDHDVLNGIVVQSGGKFYQAVGDQDITSTFAQGALQSLEGYEVIEVRSLSAEDGQTLTSIPFFLDSYAGQSLLQVQLSSVDPSGFDLSNVIVKDAGGERKTVTVRGDVGSDSITLSITMNELAAGDYELEFPAQIFGTTSQVEVLVLAKSERLKVHGGVKSDSTIEFPEPVPLQASLVSDLGVASGLRVLANVTRPDGSTRSIPLRDFGNSMDGDQEAGDGVYSAMFREVNGDGTYSVEFVFDNSDLSAYATFGVHTLMGEAPVSRFEKFMRKLDFSFVVTGYQAPGAASLVVDALEYPLDNQFHGYFESTATSTTGVLHGIRLENPSNQAVMIKSLQIDLGTSNELQERLTGVDIYVDGDKDGHPDYEGEWTKPLASISARAVDGVLILEDVLVIEAGQNLNLLLLGRFDLSPATDNSVQASLPLTGLLALVLLIPGLNRRSALASFGVLLVVVLVIGCGSSRQSFVFPNGSEPVAVNSQVTEVTVEEVQTTLRAGDIEAVGAIDGNTAIVDLRAPEALLGPRVFFDVPVAP